VGILDNFFNRTADRVVRIITDGEYEYMRPLPIRERRVVNKTSAYFSVSFISCLLAKAQPLASLPLKVYQRDEDGTKNRVRHPLEKIITKRWNSYLTAYEGWCWLIITRDIKGQAAVRVEWNAKGEPVAFWPITEPVKMCWDDVTGTVCWKVPPGDKFTKPGVYLPHEVLVFRTPVSKNGGRSGMSLAKIAADDVGLSIDLEAFYSNLLNNGTHFPGYLETDDDLDNDEKRAIAKEISADGGIVKAGTVRIFDKGLKYKQNPMTIGDMNMIEMETWVLQQCCRITGVPPAMVHENSRSTYSNVESMNMQFARNTLTNEVTYIEQVLQVVLDQMEGRFPHCGVQFDLNGYLRGDYKTRMEGYRIGIYAGFFTREEVRNWEDLPKIDGLDEPLQPTAYMQIRDGEPYQPEGGAHSQLPQGAFLMPAVEYTSPMEPVLDDMRSRIRARFSSDGDTDKTRNFARTVLRSYEKACAVADVHFDIDEEIERLSNG